MAESNVVRTKQDTVTAVVAAGGSPIYTIAKEPGDFSYDAPGFSITDILDNGVPCGVRRGDGTPCSWSFSVWLRELGSTTEYTLPDICEQRSGSLWLTDATSTLDGDSDVLAYDLTHTISGAAVGETDKTATFPDSIFRGSYQSGDPSTYSVTGRCATALAPTVV